MKMSDKGLVALQQREGTRLVAYQDVKGIWTIGVGHTGPEVKQGLVWTMVQGLDALRLDVGKAEDCINSVVGVELTQNQFDALASFIFNVGVGAFKASTMLKKINAKDFTGAIKEFDKWHIPPSITGRRNSERVQFAS